MRIGIVIVVGLALGLGAGLAIGWSLPLQVTLTSPADLSPMWKADYVFMTAQAYSLDGDLAAARQRLSVLDPQLDLGELVAQRGLQAIAEGALPEDIARLARLAAALGTRLPELEPFMAR